MIKRAFSLYNIGWRMVSPLLKLSGRLKEGYLQRSLQNNRLVQAELWIHSASVGESFITREILKSLAPARPTRVMLTTCTRQGMEILEKTTHELAETHGKLTLSVAYLPFDQPALMRQAVESIRPGLTILVELEIWPGMLYALKQRGCRVMIVNGRLTEKSLKGYLSWPSLWHHLSPETVLAISKEDKARLDKLFKPKHCKVVPNIKFDRLTPTIKESPDAKGTPLKSLIQNTFIVLGSVRQEEEEDTEKILQRIYRKSPQIITGLFPRHMHRIGQWARALDRLGIAWVLRSDLKQRAKEGTVILWDTFGELSLAYEQANSAFVGGSLAPLGGQNFLEPLACGIIPIIGPSWENFSWVGQEIVSEGLLNIVNNWEEVADTLVLNTETPPPHSDIKRRAAAYFEPRKGGTRITCSHINNFLKEIDTRKP